MKSRIFLFVFVSCCFSLYGQNVGINTTTPHAELQLSNVPYARKIVLYETNNNDHEFIGFGMDGYGALHYQTAYVGNDHVWGTGVSSTQSIETMRLTGYGSLGLGVTNPMNRLDINNGYDRTGDHAQYRALYVTGDFGENNYG